MENVKLAIESGDVAWIEFAMEELAEATSSGAVRIPMRDFRFFINCSHRLGFTKKGGVLCRGVRQELSAAQIGILSKIIAGNAELLEVVSKGVARGNRLVFESVDNVKVEKEAKKSKQSESSEGYAVAKGKGRKEKTSSTSDNATLQLLRELKSLKEEIRSLRG